MIFSSETAKMLREESKPHGSKNKSGTDSHGAKGPRISSGRRKKK